MESRRLHGCNVGVLWTVGGWEWTMHRVVCICEQLWMHLWWWIRAKRYKLICLWCCVQQWWLRWNVLGKSSQCIMMYIVVQLICMLFVGGFLPVSIDESMLHHVLVEFSQCIGMHYCTYCWVYYCALCPFGSTCQWFGMVWDAWDLVELINCIFSVYMLTFYEFW